MKIWIMTTEYPPAFGGGIGTYCYHTVNMFGKHNEDVVIFIADPSIDKNLVIENNGKVNIVRFKPGSAKYYKFMGYSAALSYEFADVIEKFMDEYGNPDIIETQEYAGIGYALLQKKWALYPKFKDVPVMSTIHTPKFLCDLVNRSPIYQFPDFWIGELEKFVIKAADGVISPSKYMLDSVKEHASVAHQSFVVPNPFEFDSLNGIIQENIGEDIFFVGRTEYRKGILQCISYLSNMWDKGFSTPLHVIGGDTFFYPQHKMMKEYLREKFSKYIDERLLIFENKMPQNELYRRVGSAKTVILPSLFENFPTVTIESMYLKRVVLASYSGGQAEMIEDGDSGFLFSHDNPETFELQLEKIMSLSDKEISSIGKRAKERIQSICNYESVYAKKMESLEQIINNSKGKKCIYPFIRGADKHIGDDIEIGSTHTHGENDLLSIVIPYFNMGNYIEETVKSVLDINYNPKEIIIVNDGSNEPLSIEMIYKIQHNYPVKIVHKENGGLASARNFGAEVATGEFLGFVDSDDFILPNYHSWAIDIMRSYKNVSFVGCWAQYFGDCEETVWPTWNPEPPYLLIHNTTISGGLVYKRKDFMFAGLNDIEMEYGMEDYESVIRMVRNGYGGVIIPEPLYKYRVRQDSMARGFNKEKILYLYRLLSEKNSPIYEKYAVEIFGLLNTNGPGFLYDNPTLNLPPVGFVDNNTKNKIDALQIDSAYEVPFEAKQFFNQLWQSKLFRKLTKLGIKLKVYKIFLR